MENRLFNETGYLLSDAALPLAYEGKEIRTVFEETNEIHKKWLENFNGDEIVYAREHGLLGHELEKNTVYQER